MPPQNLTFYLIAHPRPLQHTPMFGGELRVVTPQSVCDASHRPPDPDATRPTLSVFPLMARPLQIPRSRTLSEDKMIDTRKAVLSATFILGLAAYSLGRPQIKTTHEEAMQLQTQTEALIPVQRSR